MSDESRTRESAMLEDVRRRRREAYEDARSQTLEERQSAARELAKRFGLSLSLRARNGKTAR